MKFNQKEIQAFFNSRKKYGIKPGLDRVHKLLSAVENPEKELKAIHVTGTNGKGSTLAYLNKGLLDAGYKVGLFSSPSLTGLYGHIQLNDEDIAEEQFASLLKSLMPYIKELDEANNHPSEFEIITVLAFMYFKEQKVDIALIETGMGARQDTTNVIVPLMSVISSIALDHTQFLGESIEAITYEKAGIIKERVPLVVGSVSDESKEILCEEADKLDAPTYFLHEEISCKQVSEHSFIYAHESKKCKVTLQMQGRHQMENASLALNVLFQLKNQFTKLHEEQIVESIEDTSLAGRFEVIYENPSIIIDGAHNKASMQALIKTVKEQFPKKHVHLIFAAFKDKDLRSLADMLEDNFQDITLTTFDHERAIKTKDLKTYFKGGDIKVSEHWQDLLKNVIKENKDELIIITGSLHFIFAVRHEIEKIKRS